jgi:hypothetical protein
MKKKKVQLKDILKHEEKLNAQLLKRCALNGASIETSFFFLKVRFC